MDKISKNFWNFIDKYKIWIFFVIISVFAVSLRLQLYDYSFGDYEMFLEPWFNELKEGGRTFSFRQKNW